MRKELILIGVFLFLLLFRPTVAPIDTLYMLTGFSVIMLLRSMISRKIAIRPYLQRHAVTRNYIIVLVAMFGLSGAAFTYNWVHSGGDIESITSFFMATARLAITFVLLPLNLLWLFVYVRAKKISSDRLLKVIFYVIVTQLLFVLGAYLVPQVKDLIIWLMQANGNWTDRWTINKTDEHRMFGFAKSLFDTYGFGMGILSAVPWMIAYRQKSLSYLLLLPIIFFAIFINARTGIIIMGIVTIAFLIFYVNNRRHLLEASGRLSKVNRYTLLGICVTLAITAIGTISFLNSDSYLARTIGRDLAGYAKFVMSGGDVAATRGTQAARNFSSEWWTIPDNLMQQVIGAGQSVYGSDSIQDSSTDVGYINNIWLFGFIGTVAAHSLIIFALWRYRIPGAYGKVFAIACIASILLFQIKGSALWSANLGIASIILLYFVGNYERLYETSTRTAE